MLFKHEYGVRVKTKRDSQRSKVYKAEKVLKPLAKPLPEVRDVERFLYYVWGLKRVQQSFPRAVTRYWNPPSVADGRGCRRALAYGNYRITIPLWARNEWVVLHELTHIVVSRELGTETVPSHGWHFCAAYLRLVLLVMGREAHDALKASFKASKVKFRAPRKRTPMSLEQRAELAHRLTLGREMAAVRREYTT